MGVMISQARPPAWAVLERALTAKRPVRASYHGRERVLCPHALGWKRGRPKVLAYQSGGTTSSGELLSAPHELWRSMFIDELEDPVIADGPWQTAGNYSPTSNCFDRVEMAVDP